MSIGRAPESAFGRISRKVQAVQLTVDRALSLEKHSIDAAIAHMQALFKNLVQ